MRILSIVGKLFWKLRGYFTFIKDEAKYIASFRIQCSVRIRDIEFLLSFTCSYISLRQFVCITLLIQLYINQYSIAHGTHHGNDDIAL